MHRGIFHLSCHLSDGVSSLHLPYKENARNCMKFEVTFTLILLVQSFMFHTGCSVFVFLHCIYIFLVVLLDNIWDKRRAFMVLCCSIFKTIYCYRNDLVLFSTLAFLFVYSNQFIDPHGGTAAHRRWCYHKVSSCPRTLGFGVRMDWQSNHHFWFIEHGSWDKLLIYSVYFVFGPYD